MAASNTNGGPLPQARMVDAQFLNDIGLTTQAAIETQAQASQKTAIAKMTAALSGTAMGTS